jgi:NTP pyrophosphatase (non-canonical NTP hydrolase)
MAVASEAGELSALLRWVRGEDSDAFVRLPENRRAVEDEVADVGICLLLLCERASISLPDAMMRKIEANERKYPVEQAKGRAEKPVQR